MCDEYKLTREMVHERMRKDNPNWDENMKKCAERFKMFVQNPDLIDDIDVTNILEKHHKQVVHQKEHKNPKSFSIQDKYVCDGGDCE